MSKSVTPIKTSIIGSMVTDSRFKRYSESSEIGGLTMMTSPSRRPTEKVIIEDPSSLNEDVSDHFIILFHFFTKSVIVSLAQLIGKLKHLVGGSLLIQVQSKVRDS